MNDFVEAFRHVERWCKENDVDTKMLVVRFDFASRSARSKTSFALAQLQTDWARVGGAPEPITSGQIFGIRFTIE